MQHLLVSRLDSASMNSVKPDHFTHTHVSTHTISPLKDSDDDIFKTATNSVAPFVIVGSFPQLFSTSFQTRSTVFVYCQACWQQYSRIIIIMEGFLLLAHLKSMDKH